MLQVENNTKIIQTEIHLSFGFKEFLTNVGGFFLLYLGCSVISIFEIFYFVLMFLYQKLTGRRNQVASTEVKVDETSDEEHSS